MMPPDDAHVVTLRDIYTVGVDTREKVIHLTGEVENLKKDQEDTATVVEKVAERVNTLEKGHSKIIGVASGAATIAATAVTIIGWAIQK